MVGLSGSRILAIAVFWVCAILGGLSHAREEATLLTITITDSRTGEISASELSLSDLEALPATRFATRTNWTRGVQEFTGVAFTTLLNSYGVTDGKVEMQAINDYSIYFDVEDPTNKGAILAYEMNGKEMTARNKGPIWMVYDYDSNPEYRTETVFSRSIWQLDRISISR